jgi:hypothetical protein
LNDWDDPALTEIEPRMWAVVKAAAKPSQTRENALVCAWFQKLLHVVRNLIQTSFDH